jgi:tmRNA-binding protein|tara:strand:- start:7115 stop:7492 length:378 start_codon:yes stop_codon:yes gene_type:complete
MDNNSLDEFKIKVKQWLTIDEEIIKHESKIKELKKHKKKVLEPEITSFMVNHNITNLNTENGLIKCNERRTKKCLNKNNIRENLGQVLNDESQIEQALQLIMNNREVVVKHVLTKPKIKGKSIDT